MSRLCLRVIAGLYVSVIHQTQVMEEKMTRFRKPLFIVAHLPSEWVEAGAV